MDERITAANSVFSGVNSRDGYVPLLEEQLKDCETVYILKGSPGCGKSTLMKRLYTNAVMKNESVTAVKCSADPDSFDAVIFNDRKTAIADGTPPHPLDPAIPGIRETVINLAEGLDRGFLESNRLYLESLSFKKKRAYKSAYSMLSAAGSVDDITESLLSVAVNTDALRSYCTRLVKRNCVADGSATTVMPSLCFNRESFIYMPPATELPTRIVRDFCGFSEAVIAFICRAASEAGIGFRVIPSPVDVRRLAGVYFPSSGFLVVSNRYANPDSGKAVSCRRFLDDGFVAANRMKLRALEKLRRSLLDKARDFFAEAGESHRETERIYSFANDFNAADLAAARLRHLIFGD